MQADEGGMLFADRSIGHADFEGWPLIGRGRAFVRAIEALLAYFVPRLNAEQADIEPGIAIVSEGQSTGDLHDADRLVHTTSYRTTCPARISTRLPSPGILPPSHVAEADQSPLLADARSALARWQTRRR